MKLKKLYLFLLLAIFVVGTNDLEAQVYVAPGGTGNGTSWSDPLGSIIQAANTTSAAVGGTIQVFVKEGTYTENPSTGGGNATRDDSNMPDGVNVEIYGGFDSNLMDEVIVDENGDPCSYDPNSDAVNSGEGTILSNGESWFRINQDDGNFTAKGLNFLGVAVDEAWLGPVLTVTNKDNGVYVLEDIYIDSVPAVNSNPGVGALLYVDALGSDSTGGANGNTFDIDNVIVKDADEAGVIQFTAQTADNTLNVSNSTFLNNTVTVVAGGGVIRALGSNHIVDIENSVFCGNEAFVIDGGALYFTDGDVVTLTGNTFYDNDASDNGYGGAVFADDGVTITSTGNYFEANNAARGGAVYVDGGAWTSTNDIFVANQVRRGTSTLHEYGGAVFLSGNSGDADGIEDYIFTGAKFYGNIGGEGGAIYTLNNIGLNLLIDTSEFGNNRAQRGNSGDGGAIYSQADAKIINSNFTDNLADNNVGAGEGGAIYSNNSGLYLENNCFTNNTAIDGGSAVRVDDLLTSTDALFDVPAGIPATSNNATQLRHIAYNNTFLSNTSGYNLNGTGDDGVIGGAIVYEDVRATAAADERGGNIAFVANKVFNNITYYNTFGANNIDDVIGSGFSLLNLSSATDGDNVVAFQNNEFAGNQRGPAAGTLSTTADKTDVAIANTNGNLLNYDGAIFNTTGTKFQNIDYPILANPPALDWEGIEMVDPRYIVSDDIIVRDASIDSWDYNDITSVGISGSFTLAETTTLGDFNLLDGDVLTVDAGDNQGQYSFSGYSSSSAKTYLVEGDRQTGFFNDGSIRYSFEINIPAYTGDVTFNNTDTSTATPCTVADPSTGFICPDYSGVSNVTPTRPCSCIANPSDSAPNATQVGISTLNRNVEAWLPADLSAYIALESNEKGFVITRNADPVGNITTPEEGMIVWDTATKCLKMYFDHDDNGSLTWECISSACNP